MTKTKHSLLMSVIALILCASMLIGTTFAWFTDSVTSSNNIIKSGTLSISLSYIDDINENPQTSTAWKNVEEAGVKNQIFDYSNWEPGFTQIRHIKIENEGSLALKYLVNFVPKDINGNVINDLDALKIDGVSLADVIDVYYFDPAVQIDGREDLEGIAPLGTLSEVLAGLATSAQGTLEKDGKDIITLALKMKESAGNDYQGKTVGASFDIQLFATQLNSEKDSIDENYDKESTYPASTTEKVEGGDVIEAGDVAVTLPAGLAEANYTLDVDNTAVTTDANGDTTASFEIELYKDGVKVEPVAGVEYKVEIYVGKSLNVAEVTHNGTPVTPFDYNATTGIVSFETDSFSPFTVTYYSSEAETVEDIEAIIAKGGVITLTDDVTLEKGLVIDKDVVLNLNGKTVKGATSEALLINNGTLTIIGGTLENTAVNGGATVSNKGTLVLDGANIVGAPIGGDSGYPAYCVSNAGTMTIEEGTTISADRGCLYISGNGTTTINGGTLTNNDITSKIPGRSFTSHVVVVGYGANNKLTINGGTFNHLHTKTSGGVVINNWSAVTVDVNGGSFNGGNYFGKWDNLSDYGYGSTKTPFSVTGGTFTGFDTKFLAEGYKAETVGDIIYVIPAAYDTVATGLYQDGQTYYVYSADGFKAMNDKMADKTAGRDAKVVLCADIDMTGKTWTSVDSHADSAFEIAEIDGQGFTISNLTINGQAMFTRFAGFGDVVIKDVTFDNAVVNNSGINTSILTVQSYQNVLLDNVDVINSSITGAYKVAPLIGTVYNENSSTTVTATLKNCDVKDTVVKATSYDFCTAGMVAFVYADDNDKIEFENCTVTNVKLYAPNAYTAHAAIYTTGSETLFDEAEGVTVTNVTFENI